MKAHYRTSDGRITFELEAENAKGLFSAIAAVQEVFDVERRCGVCQSDDIRCLSRKVESFDFYELQCGNSNCRARFAFGQQKAGGALFPKRKDDDGGWLPNGGWSRWEGKGSDAGQEPQRTPPPIHAGQKVSAETQEIFDKIALKLECGAPVTLIGALNMMREAMVRSMGERPGRQAFDSIQKRYESDNPQGIREFAVIKALMAELWTAMKAKAA